MWATQQSYYDVTSHPWKFAGNQLFKLSTFLVTDCQCIGNGIDHKCVLILLCRSTGLPRIGMTMTVPLYTHSPRKFRFLQVISGIQMWKCGASNKVSNTMLLMLIMLPYELRCCCVVYWTSNVYVHTLSWSTVEVSGTWMTQTFLMTNYSSLPTTNCMRKL